MKKSALMAILLVLSMGAASAFASNEYRGENKVASCPNANKSSRFAKTTPKTTSDDKKSDRNHSSSRRAKR
ncbi:MAG: hypothetical protein KDD34_07630 [Bdellovibrionales bacterium]|nr:hypothetical protein [Bdellovibrionales bacterium]